MATQTRLLTIDQIIAESQQVIFDLDGTLVDSSASVLNCFQKAFNTCGMVPIRPLTPDIIGPPLMETFTLLTGTSDVAVLCPLADAFKMSYDTQGYQLTQVFPGVPDLLRELADSGRPLFIATNKRLLPTQRILEHLGWTSFFQRVYALDAFKPPLKGKSELLARILSDNKFVPTKTLYIGDRHEDAEAADYNGMLFAFAAWGYGEEIIDSGNFSEKGIILLTTPGQLLVE